MSPEHQSKSLESRINHPSYYFPDKLEVIDAVEAWGLNFARGSAIKYIARAGYKSIEEELHDLKKAEWYIHREIQRLLYPGLTSKEAQAQELADKHER